MRLDSLRIVPYRLPLEPPFRWRAGEVSEREGLLVRIEVAAGRVGWGDAAPLPGFSRESLAEAAAALAEVLPTLEGTSVDWPAGAHAADVLSGSFGSLALPASARYALELAILELAAAEHGIPLPGLISTAPVGELPVAALLDGEPETVVDAAGSKCAAGYRSIKLKLGRLDPESDAELARDVRRRVGAGVELRGDANRAWTPDRAAAFARRAAGAALAYVEEPLARAYVADLGPFARESGLPVALDESLAESGGTERIEPWVEAVILKPTVLGGIAATLRTANLAREAGARAVLSAAFESGVGQRGVAALAAATGGEAAGLDPYVRLRDDVLVRALPFGRPVVDVAAVFARPVEIRPAVKRPEPR
jgi:O-succinylbenzoate synthase